jgi:hypothetical protein
MPGYKDLSVDPPVTTQYPSEGDVSIFVTEDGQSPPFINMQANNGATVGSWHQSAAPTYAQCLQNAEAGGGYQVSVSPGGIVCIRTASNAVASLKLISIGNGLDSAEFSGTIWYPPGSP